MMMMKWLLFSLVNKNYYKNSFILLNVNKNIKVEPTNLNLIIFAKKNMSINYSEFFRNASSLIASADNTLKYINFSINPEAELIYKSYISDREKLIN